MEHQYDILVVDDDPFQANILEDVLRDMGYSSRVLLDGATVLEECRRARPRLVILDIIMPGMDGLSLCKLLKPELNAWKGHVVITSGKERASEESRALRAGATAFLQKPYQIPELQKELRRLIGSSQAPQAPPQSDVLVRIWGSRGPGQAPPGASRYGHRTCCVSVGFKEGELYLLDAGTGIRECSDALLSSPAVTKATLLLTHYHPGHCDGLQGLSLLARPDFSLWIGGPTDTDGDLKELIPRLGAVKAKLTPFHLQEAEYRSSEKVTVRAAYTSHPGTTLAFSLQGYGKKVVYCPDSELPLADEVDTSNNFERLKQFALGADLLIYDSHFLPEDRGRSRGKGHSSWEVALRLGVEAGVRRLCLFHAAMHYHDERLAAAEAAAQARAGEEVTSLTCAFAREGTAMQL